MGVEVVLAIVAFAIGLIVTPIYIVLFVKGVRTLEQLRELFGQPPTVGKGDARKDRIPLE